MEAKLLPHHLYTSKPTTPFLILNQHSPFITQKISLRPSLYRVAPIKATTNGNGEDVAASTPQPVIPPAQDGSKIRFRRVSRRRGSRDKDMDNNGENNKPVKKKAPPKDWDSMTYGEKAMELYVGEKGLLFWLNKFAYASIYIIIGAWIIFRFVGPSLGFYQLDTPPLSPTRVVLLVSSDNTVSTLLFEEDNADSGFISSASISWCRVVTSLAGGSGESATSIGVGAGGGGTAC